MANEKRLIDANAFIEDIKTEITELFMNGLKGTPQPRDHLYDFVNRIGEQPTVDAVEVVRCKDCKWYKEGKYLAPNKFCYRLKERSGEHIGYNYSDDDFCSYGERREGE